MIKTSLTLPQAYNLGPKKALVAFTGAGGKSTLMFALAAQLPARVLITSTTRMAASQIWAASDSLPAAVYMYPGLPQPDNEPANSKFILISGTRGKEKVTGVAAEVPLALLKRFDFVLVEADGAKMLPIKAPAAHEPAIPDGATLVVPVVGIDSLHKPIEQAAHRPLLLAKLLGKSEKERITIGDIAFLMANCSGGLKSIKEETRIIPTINKVETEEQLQEAGQIARLLLKSPRVEQVVLSQAQAQPSVLEIHKRVTAVILAAGQSKRMGYSKQLLPWGEMTVLGQTIAHVKASAVNDILVVVGHRAQDVQQIAADHKVPTVFNERYEQGEMLSSLQTALNELATQVAAVLVVLADQPMIEAETIDRLLTAYRQGQGTIIAPIFQGQRGNPVLIDCCYFAQLLALPPGSAPRDLLREHEVTPVNVDSETVLQDIDRPQDYHKFKPG